MLYKVIGYYMWNWHIKPRLAGYAKVGVGLAVVTVAATAYLAARNGAEEQE